MPNKELAKELHKPIIKKVNKGKVHSSFIENISVADLDDMQLANYYVLLIFSVNTHISFLWKIKKDLPLLMLFKNF